MKRAKTKRLKNAWVLTWEGTRGPAISEQTQLIAIFSSRRGMASIFDAVETTYGRALFSALEMATLANKARDRRERLLHENTGPDLILYGKDPCIFARRVEDLSIRSDPAAGIEEVRWTEPALYRNASVGSGIEKKLDERHCQISRFIGPLSLDLHLDEA